MNLSTAIVIIAAIAVPFVVYWLMRRRKDPLERRFAAALRTGRGMYTPCLASTWTEQGVELLTGEQRDAVDAGLQSVFVRATVRGWSKFLDQSYFTIAFLKGERYKGINALRLPNGDYVGGITLDEKKGWIVIPEHAPDELDALTQIVGYEAEHVIAFHNDRDMYERTKVHKEGEGHPIF